MDHFTVRGLVAAEPRHFTTSSGLAVTSFRLASSQSYRDRASGEWRDPGSNWFTVTCFRTLASHAFASVNKGDKVIVSGKLKIKAWTNDDKSGLNVEIEADALGHDLTWGTARFERSFSSSRDDSPQSQDEWAPSDPPEEWPTVSPGNAA